MYDSLNQKRDNQHGSYVVVMRLPLSMPIQDRTVHLFHTFRYSPTLDSTSNKIFINKLFLYHHYRLINMLGACNVYQSFVLCCSRL